MTMKNVKLAELNVNIPTVETQTILMICVVTNIIRKSLIKN